MTASLDTVGARVALHRNIAGLTQRELAARTGLHVSTVRRIEQDDLTVRLETLHTIARVVRCRTADLSGDTGDREAAHDDTVALWTPVREALAGKPPDVPDAGEAPTVAGVTAVFAEAQTAFRRGRYGDVLALLPPLIGDTVALGDHGRKIRSAVFSATAWFLVHTHQYPQARMALTTAVDDAVDRAGTAAAIHVMTWLHLRSGQLDGCHRLASQWADDMEPKMSRATDDELAAWGWLLIRVATTAVRDNRPGAANDALRLARVAATAIGREVHADGDPRRPFGPDVVTAKEAELELIAGHPDRVLALAATIPPQPPSPNTWRHYVDVAHALALLGRRDEALDRFDILRRQAPQWLIEQRSARDAFLVLYEAGQRRMPERMQQVARAIRWSGN